MRGGYLKEADVRDRGSQAVACERWRLDVEKDSSRHGCLYAFPASPIFLLTVGINPTI